MKILNKFLKVGKALIITQCLSFLVYIVFACACIRHSEYAIVVVVTLITTFVFASTILRTIAEYCKYLNDCELVNNAQLVAVYIDFSKYPTRVRVQCEFCSRVLRNIYKVYNKYIDTPILDVDNHTLYIPMEIDIYFEE